MRHYHGFFVVARHDSQGAPKDSHPGLCAVLLCSLAQTIIRSGGVQQSRHKQDLLVACQGDGFVGLNDSGSSLLRARHNELTERACGQSCCLMKQCLWSVLIRSSRRAPRILADSSRLDCILTSKVKTRHIYFVRQSSVHKTGVQVSLHRLSGSAALHVSHHCQQIVVLYPTKRIPIRGLISQVIGGNARCIHFPHDIHQATHQQVTD